MPSKDSPRRLFVQTLLTAMLLLSCAPLWAQKEAELTLMSAIYQGKISGWNVELERTLTQYPDGHYLLNSHVEKVFAAMEESSSFIIQNGKIVPQEYIYKRSIFGKKSIERIVFDWKNRTASYTRSDRKQNNNEHALKPGLLDPALYQLAIQADLAKGHEGLSYQFIKRKGIVEYHLQINKKEAVLFDNKQYEAAAVFRITPEANTSTKVWVIPSLSYMISNIQHIEKNEEYTVALSEYSVDAARPNQFYHSFTNNSNSR